jgi:undecaprenyl phosphate-alpha-L-ara4FN deformylase
MNAHALRLTQRLGYRWASDCRGSHPFIPVWNAEIVACPQLPTTLPTLDELIGTDDLTADNVHQHCCSPPGDRATAATTYSRCTPNSKASSSAIPSNAC